MSKVISIAPKRPARLSAKLRCAVVVLVEEGATITAAAERAGLTRQGLTKALKRPEVRAHVEAEKARFVAETDGKRALYKARALDVALDLLLNAKSESVRARMAEFLASDGKVSPVAVHIDARQVGGYVYAKPGQFASMSEGGTDPEG